MARTALSMEMVPGHFSSNQSRRKGCGEGQIQWRKWQPSVNLAWTAEVGRPLHLAFAGG